MGRSKREAACGNAIWPSSVYYIVANEDIKTIEFYWRPGCPFCSRLDAGLKKTKIPVNKRNIWESKKDAATVLVNPSIKQIEAALAEHAPHLL